MLKSQIVLFTFICFIMINISLTAKDAPVTPKPGPAKAEFQRVFGEWKTLLGQVAL